MVTWEVDMEKVLQILAVFALLMLFDLAEHPRAGGSVPPVQLFGPGAVATFRRGPAAAGRGRFWHGCKKGRHLGCRRRRRRLYWMRRAGCCLFIGGMGSWVIDRRMAGGRNRELQELAVPMDCSGIGWDPEERRIYSRRRGIFSYMDRRVEPGGDGHRSKKATLPPTHSGLC